MVYQESISDIKITYNHYGGIPLYLINNKMMCEDDLRNVKNVEEICDNKYVIVMNNNVGYYRNRFGGNNVGLGIIGDITVGYPHTNNYVIDLPQNYTNIMEVRMINSIFPKTHRMITDGSNGSVKNNSIYWQNMIDGPIVYHIELESGNYSANELATTIETKMNDVLRLIRNDKRTMNKYIMSVQINQNTNKTTFTSYIKYEASNNIIHSYDFLKNICNKYYTYPNGNYYSIFPNEILDDNMILIKIYYPNHTLNIGDDVRIEGLCNNMNNYVCPNLNRMMSISTSIIGNCVVTNIDDDYFDILLMDTSFRSLDDTCQTKIQIDETIKIYSKNKLRTSF